MKWTNNWNLPDRIIRQVGKMYQPKPNRLSVTHLINCPRERHLLETRWDDVVLDYRDFLSTIIGIAVHERQDRLSTEDEQHEEHLETKVGEWTVVGRSDNRDGEIIRETKTKSTFILQYEKAKKDFLREVEFQLNVYAHLHRLHGNYINALELDLFFRDWKQRELEQAQPKYAVVKRGRKRAIKLFDTQESAENFIEMYGDSELSVEFRESKFYPKTEVEHSMPIELWTPERAEQYVQDQVELFTLDPMYCDDQCTWEGRKCAQYCKARSVCEKSPCFLGKDRS